ncbi:MAG TPA: hypothetical protein VLH38_05685 [Patescibacteria group bacterium]|nr:hypothetical protein [Patescibacteria group bacterium]
MLRKLFAPFATVALVFSLVVGTTTVYAEGFQITKIAPDNNLYINGLHHAIEGSRAAFADNVTNGTIDYYDGTTITPLIHRQDAQIGRVVLNGSHIAWLQKSTDNDPTSKYQVFLYDMTDGQTRQLTYSPEDIQTFDIDGDYMVWGTEDIGSANAYLYRISTGNTTSLNNYPFTNIESIDGDSVTLVTHIGGNRGADTLYVYSISTGTTTQISTGSPTTIGGVYMDEGNIVWFARTNGYFQIYRYDGSQTTQLTTDAGDHYTPRISGNNMTWNDPTPTPSVALYNIATATKTTLDTTASNAYIDGDRIVYTKVTGSNGNQADVMTHNLATGQTSTIMAHSVPFSTLLYVNDTMVVWHGLDTHQVEGTYVAKFGFPDPDNTASELGTPVWSANPKSTASTSTLTVPATDNVGVTGGEYFLGDNDPGQGNGAPMGLSGGNLTANFGTDYPSGVYKVTIRAKDAAGNWSQPTSDFLVVYNPEGPRMTGRRTITPMTGNGDILPGLESGPPPLLQAQVATEQPDIATFGFNVRYAANGTIGNNSDMQFTYKTGTHCNNAARAQNCHTTSMNATTINWLVTQDTNNSTGIFQGMAQLTVDGSTSTVLFRVTGRDGARLDSTASDQFQLRIFNQSDNPNTATPLYQVNTTDITRGNIRIMS